MSELATIAALARRWQGGGPVAVALALVIALLGAMAAEPTSKLLEQRERIEGMVEDLRSLRAANRRLETRVQRLRDPDFVEQRARAEIGLTRPGETSYIVIPPKPGRDPRRRKPPSAPAAPAGGVWGFLQFLGVP